MALANAEQLGWMFATTRQPAKRLGGAALGQERTCRRANGKSALGQERTLAEQRAAGRLLANTQAACYAAANES